MLKGCKIRLYPTKEQEEILFIYCKYAHQMRNFLVAKFQKELPKTNGFGIRGYNEGNLLEEFGQTDIPLPKRLVRGVLYNYKFSVDRIYLKLNNKPKFHKYIFNKQSFYLPSQTLNINNFTIKMPMAREFKFKGKSKIVVDNKYILKFDIQKVKEPRFKYEKGKWFITGSYETLDVKKIKATTIIGLDWGIKNFMTTSTGFFINYPKSVTREFYRISKLQKIRDNKTIHSNNWEKINNKISKAYERMNNLKKDFIEKTTTKLCKNNDIAVEDLTNAKIRISSKNRRRLMQINPLTKFIDKLNWKCKKYGTNFYKVNPAYTSQMCSCCKKINKLSLNDRIFYCSCGNNMDRDINAAINIAAMATCNSQ